MVPTEIKKMPLQVFLQPSFLDSLFEKNTSKASSRFGIFRGRITMALKAVCRELGINYSDAVMQDIPWDSYVLVGTLYRFQGCVATNNSIVNVTVRGRASGAILAVVIDQLELRTFSRCRLSNILSELV